jgi:Family of unknown function (DUF6516)
MKDNGDHTLEFLLAFDGRRHWYEGGYCAKFEIKRTRLTRRRPHGLRYSFTLHDPDGVRLVGFDNAHAVAAAGSRFKKRPAAADHWHRTENDLGRPYAFTDAATLIDDFFDEIERVLTERGISFAVISDEAKDERNSDDQA